MIVVTGAATGIGLAVASAFAQCGKRVAMTGRRAGLLREAAARIGAVPVPCDSADPAALQALVDACAEGVDVLVNNAGGNTDIGAPEPRNLAEVAQAWTDNYTANVVTAVLTTTALTPLMNDGGRVINIGSIAADTGAGSYGAAKAAVAAWTVDLARDLGPRGITVNNIAPGYIEETEFFRGRMTAERRDRLVAATLNKRVGTPADIADLAVFLASPGAGHITGQTLHVNGGARTSR